MDGVAGLKQIFTTLAEDKPLEGNTHLLCWYCRKCKDMVDVEGPSPLPEVVNCPKCGSEKKRHEL